MSLLKLPAEIKEHIAESLELADLCSLRLTCRDINEAILRRFTSMGFHQLSFDLSEDELRGAIDAVEHPRYGEHVKVVRILVDDIPGFERDHGYQTPRSMNNPSLSSCPSFEDQALYHQQARIRSQNIDLHLLTALFCKLRGHGNVDTVEVAEAKQKSYNTAAMITTTNKARRRPPLLDDRRPILIILEALTSSGLRPDIFMTDCNDWAVPIHVFRCDSSNMSNFTKSLSNVKKLQLHVWVGSGYNGSVRDFIPYGLSKLSNLEHLHLSVRTKAGHDQKWARQEMGQHAILSELVMVEFKKLRVLWLTGQDSSILYTNIVDLLTKNASLQSFRAQKLFLEGLGHNYNIEVTESMEDVLKRDTGIEDLVLDDCIW